MVYYNPLALEDYSNILYGLLNWPKHPLEPEHARQYMHDIVQECNSLDYRVYHFKASYKLHILYGEYVYNYKRNKNTCWYIIYNMNLPNDVFIERIMNNYLTTA